MIYNYFNNYPFLILDDVLSELDEKRQNSLFSYLSNNGIQTIITTTDINDINDDVKFNKINLEILDNV